MSLKPKTSWRRVAGLAAALLVVAACKKDKDDDAGTEPAGDTTLEVLRIEGAWQDAAALVDDERPTSLLCLTVESTPKSCRLPISAKAFAGDCPGFAGIEFACFPQSGAQVVGFTHFDAPLPAYGIGTLFLDITYDAATFEARAVVNPAKTTAPAGAATDRVATVVGDLSGAWNFAVNPALAEIWSADTPTQALRLDANLEASTVAAWDSAAVRNACTDTDGQLKAPHLRQGTSSLWLRLDTLSHFDEDIDTWFAGLSAGLKQRLRAMTRYFGRYGSLPPCEIAGDCGTDDFATLGPRDVQRLRDMLVTTLFEDPGVLAETAASCTSHTVPKNFNFKMCGPSALRACDVVKMGLDAPLGLEVNDKGVLEAGELPSASRFDASYEWLCPQAYADHRSDDEEGATDVPAALLACRIEFMASAPTAYKQAVLLEDWYNLENQEYVLLCSSSGATAEQKNLAADMAASCTPEVWRQANCVDDQCKAAMTCPYARPDGVCTDQSGKFLGNLRGQKPSLTLTPASGGTFALVSDTTTGAKQTVDGVELTCERKQRQRIYGLNEADGKMSGFYVSVTAGGCAGADDDETSSATGVLFPFIATRQ